MDFKISLDSQGALDIWVVTCSNGKQLLYKRNIQNNDTYTSVIYMIMSVIQSIINKITTILQNAMYKIMTVIQGVISKITAVIQNVIYQITTAMQGVMYKIITVIIGLYTL